MNAEMFNKYIKKAYSTFKPLRDLYDDNGVDINKELIFSNLPFINKDILCRYGLHEKFGVPFDSIFKLFTTSGTTAKPQFVAFTKNDWNEVIEILSKSFKNSGVSSKDIFYDLIPKNTTFAGHVAASAAENAGALVIPAGKMETEQHVRVITELKPTVLNGLSFFIVKIGNMLPLEVRKCVKTIFSVGECLYDETRCVLKTLYPNAVVCSGYGVSEVFVSNECRMNNGIHYDNEKVLVEVINKNEQGIGELVFTSLYSEAMPLIRYRSGDLGFLINDKCPCGCNQPRLKVLGRIDAMFNIKGKLLSVELLKKTVFEEKGIEFGYCLYYPNNGSKFEIIYSGNIDEDHLKYVIKQRFDITPVLIKNNNMNDQWKHRFITEMI